MDFILNGGKQSIGLGAGTVRMSGKYEIVIGGLQIAGYPMKRSVFERRFQKVKRRHWAHID